MTIKWRRRLVGRVGIVEVNPGEETPVYHRTDPGASPGDDLFRPSFVLEEQALVPAAIEVVSISVETLVEAPLGIENVGPDERAGRVPFLFQQLAEQGEPAGDERSAVVPDLMVKGVCAGQDGGVRGKGQRGLSNAALEQRALPRQVIEVRCGRAASPISGNVIGAKCVDRDQDDAKERV